MPPHRLRGYVSAIAPVVFGGKMVVEDPKENQKQDRSQEGKGKAKKIDGLQKEGETAREREAIDRGRHNPARRGNRRKDIGGTLTNRHRPRHIPCRLPKQPNRRIRNLPHSPQPPQRNSLRTRLQILLPRQPLQSLRTADAPRRNDVGGDASRTKFQGDIGGQGVDAGFGDGDVRLERGASVVDCGGDEDYAAAEGGG